jgi:pimeloyl-ACP methyl ester carboxylesterase
VDAPTPGAGGATAPAAVARSERPPVLVCLHGLSGSSRWWAATRPRLEEGGPVVVLDAPRSLRPDEVPDWVAEEVEALEPPVDLAGHSLGGLVCARVASLRPDLVRRLVLVAPAGIAARGPATYAWPLVRTLAASRPAHLATLTADALRAGPWNILRGGLHVCAPGSAGDLAGIEAPTLLVWGARDRLVPPTEGHVWKERLAGSRLVVLPDAGHVPMLEAPDDLGALIAAFREERLDENGHFGGM